MARSLRKQKAPITSKLTWDNNTELVGLKLELQPQEDLPVPMYFTTELHSWFLDQVRRMDMELSTYLHDGARESLQAIAQDLKMPYETVKTYAKLARQAAQKQVSLAE